MQRALRQQHALAYNTCRMAHGAQTESTFFVSMYVYVWEWVGRSGTQDIACDFCIWHLAASTLHSTWVEKNAVVCIFAFDSHSDHTLWW